MEEELEKALFSVRTKYPERECESVIVESRGESFGFVMTSPDRVEWRKYRQEISAAGKDLATVEEAMERAVTAQIRYPERETVKALFNKRPAMANALVDLLHRLAGEGSEAREKK